MEVTPEHRNTRTNKRSNGGGDDDSSNEEEADRNSELAFEDVKEFDGDDIDDDEDEATVAATATVTPRPLPKRRKKTVVSYKDDDADDDGEKPTVTYRKGQGRKKKTSGDKVANKNDAGSNKDDTDDTEEQEELPPIPFGFTIKKQFEDDNYYNGQVASETPAMTEDGQLVWKILYEDGDTEDLNRQEIMEVAVDVSKLESRPVGRSRRGHDPEQEKEDETKEPDAEKVTESEATEEDENEEDKQKEGENEEEMADKEKDSNDTDKEKAGGEKEDEEEAPKPLSKPWNGYKSRYNNYDDVLHDLVSLIGITHEEAKAALAQMNPPYGINKAVQLIHQAKKDPTTYQPIARVKFVPHIGMRVCKNFHGNQYWGTVANDGEKCIAQEDGKEITCWKVEWDDGDYEDMDFEELLQSQANRPLRPHPVRGRQLNSLEIFSGCGIVSQEFANRRWRVRSMDIDRMSNATDKIDIMSFRFEDIDMIPDFIWASPPCFTYSLMAGGKHRSPHIGKYEMSPEAHENNRYLARLTFILKWAINKHPHLVICIENPVGLLQKMPLMQKLAEDLNLKETIVHYCALGRDDMKPTFIWTNDFNLQATLSQFKCKDKCPYTRNGLLHPIGAREQGHRYNAAAIPQPLAEEVADHVHSEFYRRRIRDTKEAVMTEEEIAEFNAAVAGPKKASKKARGTAAAAAAGTTLEDATSETRARAKASDAAY